MKTKKHTLNEVGPDPSKDPTRRGGSDLEMSDATRKKIEDELARQDKASADRTAGPDKEEAPTAADGTGVDAGDQIAARMVHSTELGGVATAPVDRIVKGFKKKERERGRNDIESVLKAHPVGSTITSPTTDKEYVMVGPKRGMLQAFENTPANQKKLATAKRITMAIVKLLKSNPKLLQALSENKQLVEKVVAGLDQKGYFNRCMPTLNEHFKFNNNSSMDSTQIEGFIKDFMPFAQKKIGWNKSPVVNFASDTENASKTLGKTAHYNPSNFEVTVFVDGRHPKDILRSLSHELVHHSQNCRGEFDGVTTLGEQPYMQTSEHLSEMERQAYEVGNMTFRIWEDNYKHTQRENKKMSINEETVRAAVKEALMKRIKEVVVREPGDTSPLTPEEIKLFLAASGHTGVEVAPPGVSGIDVEEVLPPGVTAADVAEMAPEEEEELEEYQDPCAELGRGIMDPATGECVEDQPVDESTDREWYRNTLNESLIKRFIK